MSPRRASGTGRRGLAMAYVRSHALSRGVFGGSRPWLAVAGVVWGSKALRKALGRQTGVIWSGRIDEGEQVLVTYRPARRRR